MKEKGYIFRNGRYVKGITEDRLLEIYSELPTMPSCKKNCDSCCQYSPRAAKIEIARLKRILPTKNIPYYEYKTMPCPYYKNGECSIYEVRPLVCRLYGVTDSPNLTCVKGYTIDYPLSEAQALKYRDEVYDYIK